MSYPTDVQFIANGIRQHAISWGEPGSDRHTVVMLHGIGSNCWDWFPLGSRLWRHAGDRLHVLALDHRGAGDSEKPETGYDPLTCAADVLAVVDQVAPGDRVTFVGHSRGGWMSALLAGRNPGRTAGLVLVDPARMVWPSVEAADAFYDQVAAGLGPFPDFAAALAQAQRAHPHGVWNEDRLRGLRFGLTERDGLLVGKLPRRVLEQLRSVRLERDLVGPVLGDITAPTLLLVASTSDERRQGEKLAYAEGIPHARVEFHHTSHYMHIDAPDAIAASVLGHLGSYIDGIGSATR